MLNLSNTSPIGRFIKKVTDLAKHNYITHLAKSYRYRQLTFYSIILSPDGMHKQY